MKIKNKSILTIAFLSAILISSNGCKKEFLKPDPLSFYEPSVTFTTKQGLQAAITACNRNLVQLYTGDAAPILTEMLFSEVAVNANTGGSGPAQDLNAMVTPTSDNYNANTNKATYFWDQGYSGIKYANTIVSNIDKVEGLDPTLRNQMLGMAYFHRAFRYLWLVFDYGDVPLITREVTRPKFNFRSTKGSVILEKMTADMEFAVANVPAVGDFGGVNKGACQQLLIKYYLATGKFDKAIETANSLINSSGYSLMINTFGTFINPMPAVHNITRNVIWDLHRPQNKSIGANKEAIMTFVNREENAASRFDMTTMRNATPFFVGTGSQLIITPSGKAGLNWSYSATFNKIDQRKAYGRGIGTSRGTWYSTNAIWDDPNDLRHSSSTGNWMRMEDLVYNNPTLQSSGDPYYGKKLQLYNSNGKMLVTDTIRCWYDWPHYKLWVESPRAENQDMYNGGAGDWYIYRLAETYLLRAEAYFWKGDLQSAANDVNTVRRRAQCTKMYTAGEMTMGKIMDERARELNYEEMRHMELSRVSYIFASTGKSDEFGKSYTVANLSKDSYWYTRVITYNNFYRQNVQTTYGSVFRISPYHIYYPVPQRDIDANREGRINQPIGYSGSERNIKPIDNLEEALALEIN
ncbi:RagB/SusD family nutrient uptake outer membrane protein [Pedobacter miscanthi]|uniref:RagB/SusD family nutrient uptake outer membrane protein n=1 Tax=Pedobacter miscanthi TaxID=2259170 RepID=UPI00292D75DE|nr:RagB/SusD family nutrient uptake outer membrane protein [Pedobacter miscanthi]